VRLKDINFNKIQSSLAFAYNEAKRVRSSIGLGALSIAQDQFLEVIEKKLNKFEIIYTNKLCNFEFNGQKLGHFPSLTIYKEQYDKEKGGWIYIYDRYSEKKKRELLIHEFIHLKDALTPTWSTNNHDQNNVYMLSPEIVNRVELTTDLIALALMIPINDLHHDLFDCSYDMNIIIKKYQAIEIGAVIKWVILHDYFNAHFAILYFFKDKNGKEIYWKADEYYNTNSKFDISNILCNVNSISYKSWQNKQSLHGDSTIDDRIYQCFCFFEKDVEQPLPSNISPLEQVMLIDTMVVIGWSKFTYNLIGQLEFKQKNTGTTKST